jgi:DNA-binding MarR family transcriptional regulator
MRLVAEIERSRGPLEPGDLARRLGLDRQVVVGMIRLLEDRGRLRRVAAPDCPGECGRSCRVVCPLWSRAPGWTDMERSNP